MTYLIQEILAFLCLKLTLREIESNFATYHVLFFAIEDTNFFCKKYRLPSKKLWKLKEMDMKIQKKVSFKPTLFHQNVLLK